MRQSIETSDDAPLDASLALHVLPHRVLHDDGILTQEELAFLTGISVRQLRRLEQATILPGLIKFIFAAALARDVLPEHLIAPEVLRDLRDDVNERRAKLGLREAHVLRRSVRPRVLAVSKSHYTVAYAVVEPEHVRHVERQHLRRIVAAERTARIHERVHELLQAFGCTRLVADERTGKLISHPLVVTVSLAEAGALVLPRDDPFSRGNVHRHLLDRHPALRHHVRLLASGDVSEAERDNTTLLNAVALGLAVHRRDLISRYSSNQHQYESKTSTNNP